MELPDEPQMNGEVEGEEMEREPYPERATRREPPLYRNHFGGMVRKKAYIFDGHGEFYNKDWDLTEASSTSNPVGAPTTMRKGSKVVVYGPHAAAKGSCSEVPVSEVSDKDKETEASDNSLKNQESAGGYSAQCCMDEQAELRGSSLDQEN